MRLVRAESLACGRLADVVETSLVLATEPNRHDFLVGVSSQGKFAVAIDRAGGFRAFECENAHQHFGIIIPQLNFEIDILRASEPYEVPSGALLRSGHSLLISTAAERFSEGTMGPVRLLEGLPVSPTGTVVSFPHWVISIQNGPKRVRLYSSEKGREVED